LVAVLSAPQAFNIPKGSDEPLGFMY